MANFKPTDTEQEYFLQQDLELIAKLREENLAHRKTETHARHCPVDGAALVQKEFNGVVVDVCPTCHGVWLDAGELEAITHVKPTAVGGFLQHLFGR